MKQILTLVFCVGLILGCASPVVTPAPTGGGSTSSGFTAITGAGPLTESITSFSVSTPAGARGIVNRFDHTIKVYFPASVSSYTNITPTIVTKSGVTVTSPTGPVDLTNPVVYSLSDGSTYTAQAFSSVVTANTVNGWLGTGINLGNDLEAWPGVEGSWTQNVVAQKYFFDDYKKMGFTSVRIPITWGMATKASDRLDSNAPYTINATFMARIKTVVDWALDAGLTVVINAHHEDWIRTLDDASYPAQLPRFKALWTQIAQTFASYPPQLVFEVLNEPQPNNLNPSMFMTNSGISAINAAILPIIRSTNPTRVVIVGANDWNSISALQKSDFTLPSDSYIIANFHNYNPWSFAGQSSGTWGSATDIQNMTNDLTSVKNWANTKTVPLYMGEYGVTLKYKGALTDLPSRATWYRNTSALAKARGIAMILWDDYGDFKIYDRVNRTYDKAVIDAVMGR